MARSYTVVAGDTLSELARRFYGDANLYPLIAGANNITDPDVIVVGQVLVIPDLPTMNPKLQPFSAMAEIDLPDGDAVGSQVLFTVPVGKRLVLEDINVHAATPAEQGRLSSWSDINPAS